jgi:predicted lipoprotein with Yx(FWY)xxD motif
MRFPPVIAAAALGAIVLAACGSGGAYSSSPSTKPPASTPIDAAALVKTANTSLGSVLVDGKGLTLYGFTQDSNGTSTCVDACASTWPPLTVDGASLPAGLDAKVFSVVARSDGSHQLKAGKWPLYRFAGDAAPGDTNGQGSEGFFVVTPTGMLHKS